MCFGCVGSERPVHCTFHEKSFVRLRRRERRGCFVHRVRLLERQRRHVFVGRPARRRTRGLGRLEDGAIVDPDGNIIDPKDSRPPSKVNTTTETVDVDGNARSYVLLVPKTYNASKSYPLVIGLPCDGQSAATFQPHLHFEDVSGDDAIIAYPDGSVDLFTPYDQNGDQKLIERTIAALKGKFNIDAAKVWALGYSKGAFQLNQIACRKPNIFTAMAIHAGGAPQDRQAGKPKRRRLPELGPDPDVRDRRQRRRIPAAANSAPSCGRRRPDAAARRARPRRRSARSTTAALRPRRWCSAWCPANRTIRSTIRRPSTRGRGSRPCRESQVASAADVVAAFAVHRFGVRDAEELLEGAAFVGGARDLE